MRDEHDDVSAVVSETSLALRGKQQAAVDVEELQTSYHAEQLEMVSSLCETN